MLKKNLKRLPQNKWCYQQRQVFLQPISCNSQSILYICDKTRIFTKWQCESTLQCSFNRNNSTVCLYQLSNPPYTTFFQGKVNLHDINCDHISCCFGLTPFCIRIGFITAIYLSFQSKHKRHTPLKTTLTYINSYPAAITNKYTNVSIQLFQKKKSEIQMQH